MIDDVEALKSEKISLVMLDRAPRDASCSLVSSKHLEGARMAVQHLMAVGALKKLQRMGLHVPDQVALVGFDGIDLTLIVEPEITTVAQPIYGIGMLSTRLLIKKIEGDTQEEQIHLFDVTLIPRGSTERKRTDE